MKLVKSDIISFLLNMKRFWLFSLYSAVPRILIICTKILINSTIWWTVDLLSLLIREIDDMAVSWRSVRREELLTHSLERGIRVEVLGRLLVRAGDLSHSRIGLCYHHRCLSHVVHVVTVYKKGKNGKLVTQELTQGFFWLLTNSTLGVVLV